MRISLYVNGVKVRFGVDLGWFPGEEFRLLSVMLGEWSNDTLYLINLQIVKLVFCLYVGKAEL